MKLDLEPEKLVAWMHTAGRMFTPGTPEQEKLRKLSQLQGLERDRYIAGLHDSLTTLLALLKHASPEQRMNIERDLKERALPPLWKLEAICRNTHKKILRRGEIRDDDEYDMIREFMSNVDWGHPEERSRFDAMLRAYETRSKPNERR